jgi:hypothetical protein
LGDRLTELRKLLGKDGPSETRLEKKLFF